MPTAARFTTEEAAALYAGSALHGEVTLSGGLNLIGSYLQTGSRFLSSTGNFIINGNFTLNGGRFTAPTSLLDVTGVTTINGGTFIYSPNAAIREQRSVSGAPILTFPLTGVTIAVIANTDLSEIQVTRYEQNHPGAAPSSTQTGRYWALYPTGSGFTVNLTLPTSFAPDAADKLCRYTAAPGYGWDCGISVNHTFTSDTITRYGITAFSDWTVGDDSGPTAVTITSFVARRAPVGYALWLAVLLIVATLGFAMHKRASG